MYNKELTALDKINSRNIKLTCYVLVIFVNSSEARHYIQSEILECGNASAK